MTFDLDDIARIVDRPGATPAPWAATDPTDPPQYPHTPWRPRVVDVFPVATDPALDGRPPVAALRECGCGVLKGEVCDCDELAAQVAAAPVIWFGPTRKAA